MSHTYLVGRSGQMGKEIEVLCHTAGHRVVGGYSAGEGKPQIPEGTEVIIDFSAPGVMQAIWGEAVRRRIPVISGTTGLTSEQAEDVRQAAKEIAVVQASNFSVGISLLTHLVEQVALALRDRADVEIVETHHNRKKDAPSGTAVALASAIAGIWNTRWRDVAVFGRSPETPVTSKGDIVFHSLRGANVVGDHAVKFFLENEIIEIGHRATSRSIFAQGAVDCIPFMIGRTPGLYGLSDVLFR